MKQMVSHLCNTYSNIGDVLRAPKQNLADLSFSTYLAHDYISASLSMLCIGDRIFLEIFGSGLLFSLNSKKQRT